MNFARLNHILVPETRTERDLLRSSLLGRLTRPAARIYLAFSRAGLALVLMWLFLGVAAVDMEVSDIYVLWSLLAGLIVANLLLRPAFTLDHVEMSLNVARRVAAGAPLRLTLTVHNTGSRPYSLVSVRPPFLPWDGRWLGAPPEPQPLLAGESVRFETTARFVQRGEHDLDPFEVGVLLPTGLAIGPTLSSPGARFLVVPRLANVMALEADSVLRDAQDQAPAGTLGDTDELFSVREYVPGDRVRDLHARTWARTGKPHVHQYRRQHTAHVTVLLALHARGLSEDQEEAGVMLCAGIVAFLLRGGTLIDLVVAGAPKPAVTVGRGFGNLDQALDVLARAVPSSLDRDEAWLETLTRRRAPISMLLAVTQAESAWPQALAAWASERGTAHRIFRITEGGRSLLPGAGPRPLESRTRLRPQVDIEARHILDRRPVQL